AVSCHSCASCRSTTSTSRVFSSWICIRKYGLGLGALVFELCPLDFGLWLFASTQSSKFQVPSSKFKVQSSKSKDQRSLQFPPVSAVAFDQFKRRLWSPRTSFVVRKIRRRLFPVFQNRRHDLPTTLDHIATRVERRIPQHAIKQQTFV